MSRAALPVLLAATAASAVLVVMPEAAPAASAGDQVGDLIRQFVSPVMIAMAAAVGIGALVKRDVGAALTLVVLVIILSGFLMKDSPILDVANSMWQQIAASN